MVDHLCQRVISVIFIDDWWWLSYKLSIFQYLSLCESVVIHCYPTFICFPLVSHVCSNLYTIDSRMILPYFQQVMSTPWKPMVAATVRKRSPQLWRMPSTCLGAPMPPRFAPWHHGEHAHVGKWWSTMFLVVSNLGKKHCFCLIIMSLPRVCAIGMLMMG